MSAMREDATRTARDVTTAARETALDAVEATREGMARAADYARTQAGRASERVGHLASDAGAAVEDWTTGARRGVVRARAWINAHPLQVLAGTVAVGYVLGGILFRSRAEEPPPPRRRRR
jgi:hypothetical protein